MADDNKPLKYMRYAIGEIALVMIGILLALQINNWNEQRKEHLLEFDILKEIRTSLKVDLEDVEFNLAIHTAKLTSQNIIIDWMKSDQSFTDSLSVHFEVVPIGTFFAYYEGPYKTLNQLGMRIIKNDSLRNQISKLYDQVYQGYITLNNYYIDNVGKLEDSGAIHFNEWSFKENKMKPLNDNDLKSNKRYLYRLKSTKNYNKILIYNTFPQVIEEINKTVQMIDIELEAGN